MTEYKDIDELLGKVFTSVKRDNDRIIFENDDEVVTLEHHQSCCESVYIEDIVGDLDDLAGETIRLAEKATNDNPDVDCGLWTFYKFATRFGYVDIRWYGSSNGYYGVEVSCSVERKNQDSQSSH